MSRCTKFIWTFSFRSFWCSSFTCVRGSWWSFWVICSSSCCARAFCMWARLHVFSFFFFSNFLFFVTWVHFNCCKAQNEFQTNLNKKKKTKKISHKGNCTELMEFFYRFISLCWLLLACSRARFFITLLTYEKYNNVNNNSISFVRFFFVGSLSVGNVSIDPILWGQIHTYLSYYLFGWENGSFLPNTSHCQTEWGDKY